VCVVYSKDSLTSFTAHLVNTINLMNNLFLQCGLAECGVRKLMSVFPANCQLPANFFNTRLVRAKLLLNPIRQGKGV